VVAATPDDRTQRRAEGARKRTPLPWLVMALAIIAVFAIAFTLKAVL